MAQAKSTKDLVKAALQHAGELTDGTSEFHDLALTYINRLYKDILSGSNTIDIDIGERWSWARERTPKSLILEPAYTAGSVSITNGLSTATLSTPPAFSLKDRYLKITERNDPTYYKIIAHTAASPTLTLDSIVVEETGAALAYRAIPLIYNLGTDVLRLVEPMRVYDVLSDTFFMEDESVEGKIYSMDINTFRKDYPLKSLKDGIPSRFAILHQNETEFLVQFNAYPSKQVKIDFDWIKIPVPLLDADDNLPLVPWQFREVLAFGGAYYLLQDKTDDKANLYLQLAQAQLKAMKKAEVREASMTDKNFGRPLPRQEDLDKWARRRLFTTAR